MSCCFITAEQVADSVGVGSGLLDEPISVLARCETSKSETAGGAMILRAGVRTIFRLAPLGAALFLGGCDWAVLDPKGPIGDGDATLLVEFGGHHARHRGPDHHRHPRRRLVVPVVQWEGVLCAGWEYSGQLELIVWAIPLLTIMLLGGVTWIGSYDLDPARPIVSKEEPLNVQVVSLDWKWLFIYPRAARRERQSSGDSGRDTADLR